MEEAVESCRKRKHAGDRNDESAPEFYGEIDDEDEVALLAELQIEEEAVVAVMRKLEEEIRLPSPSASSAAVSRFMRPNPRVSIVNGGSELESCGSSFSDSTSTVMASVDGTSAMAAVMTVLVGGPRDRGPAVEVWPWAVAWPGEAVGPSGGGVEEEEEEEEWLARVLAGPGFELEECFL